MSSSLSLGGIYSAQWIPVDKHGHVDRVSLGAHVEFERRNGISGVLALGSTGEFPRFSVAERKNVLSIVAELASPLPVLANVSDIRPAAAIELGKFARELGLPGVALMPPVFYPLSQADLLAYFLHVADGIGLPVMLYNFPELAGNRIDLKTVAAFAERAPLLGIKQSGGEFAYHRDLIALGREKRFAVMSGADTRLTEVLGLGAAGCIGGLVNIVPDLMVSLVRAHQGTSGSDPAETGRRLIEVGQIIDRLTFPLNVGAGLEARGFNPGPPKAIVSAESMQIYREIVHELRARFDAWNLPGPVPKTESSVLIGR